MRGDAMRWIGWLVVLVFGGGVLAIVSLVVSLVLPTLVCNLVT